MKRLAFIATASLLLTACTDAIPTSPAVPVRTSLNFVREIVVEDLGTLPGGNYSYFNDINEAGHAVGDASSATGGQHAIRWSPADGMIDLGALPGNDISGAWSINDAGEIVGFSLSESAHHAVMWPANGGPILDLGTLGGNYKCSLGHQQSWSSGR